MRKQCVPGVSPPPSQTPGYEAIPGMTLPCASLIACVRAETATLPLELLCSPIDPIAIDSDSGNEGSEFSLLVLASPLAHSSRPKSTSPDVYVNLVVDVAIIHLATAKHPCLLIV